MAEAPGLTKLFYCYSLTYRVDLRRGNVPPKVTFTLPSLKQPHLNPQESRSDTHEPIGLYCRSY